MTYSLGDRNIYDDKILFLFKGDYDISVDVGSFFANSQKHDARLNDGLRGLISTYDISLCSNNIDTNDSIFVSAYCLKQNSIRQIQSVLRGASRVIYIFDHNNTANNISYIIRTHAQIFSSYQDYKDTISPDIEILICLDERRGKFSDKNNNSYNINNICREISNLFGSNKIFSKFYKKILRLSSNTDVNNNESCEHIGCEDFDRDVVLHGFPVNALPVIECTNGDILLGCVNEYFSRLRLSGVVGLQYEEYINAFKEFCVNSDEHSYLLKDTMTSDYDYRIILEAMDKRGIVRFFPENGYILLFPEVYMYAVGFIYHIIKHRGEPILQNCVLCNLGSLWLVDPLSVKSIPQSIVEKENERNMYESFDVSDRANIISSIIWEAERFRLLKTIMSWVVAQKNDYVFCGVAGNDYVEDTDNADVGKIYDAAIFYPSHPGSTSSCMNEDKFGLWNIMVDTTTWYNVKNRQEAIKELAYSLWEHDGRKDFKSDKYWLIAEQIIDRRLEARGIIDIDETVFFKMQHAIQEMAYKFWQDAGEPFGISLDFWLLSERLVEATFKRGSIDDEEIDKIVSDLDHRVKRFAQSGLMSAAMTFGVGMKTFYNVGSIVMKYYRSSRGELNMD